MRADGQTIRGGINLNEDGRISWGSSGAYVVDEASASHTSVRWVNNHTGRDFFWTRMELSAGEGKARETGMFALPGKGKGAREGKGKSKGKARDTAKAAPHFCIFQGDALGL